MILMLNMEFISLLGQDFLISPRVRSTREDIKNLVSLNEINSIFNVKPLNILYIFFFAHFNIKFLLFTSFDMFFLLLHILEINTQIVYCNLQTL